MSPTYQIAIAAGRDAGNRSMAAAGRKKWSLADHRAAAKVFHQLYNAPAIARNAARRTA